MSQQKCAPENKRGNGSLFRVKVEGHSRADHGILKMESPRSNQPKGDGKMGVCSSGVRKTAAVGN